MKKGVWGVLVIFLLIFSNVPFFTAQTEYDLAYDSNGNLIQGFNKYFEYNNFNHLKTVRENNAQGRTIEEYFYDDEGNRIKKVEVGPNGNNQTIYYINENFIQIRNSSGIFNETYYYDENNLIAKKDSNGKKYYYHPDHLGSITLITNESGSIVEETFYLPYGEIVEGGSSRYLFTGKEKDKGTDLYYYGTRYYNPFFKHFIQPDNVLSNVYAPQQLNRYSYVINNPDKYTDPEGEWIHIAFGGVIGGLAATVHSLYRQVILGEFMSVRGVLSSVGSGVVGGAVFAGTFGLVSGALGATTAGGMVLSGIGAGTTAGVISAESGLATSSILSGNIGILKDPMVHARTQAIGSITGAIAGGISGGINALSVSNAWSKSTFPSASESLNKHYQKHVANMGIPMTKDQYTKNAQKFYSDYINGNFPSDAKINVNHPLRAGGTGIKITVGDEMGIYTDKGKIVSYQPLKTTTPY